MSMVLFTLVVYLLLSGHVPGVMIARRTQRTSVATYADGITIVVTNMADMRCVGPQGRATGARLNIKKSKALVVDSWDSSMGITYIPYY
jgi:Ni,Fe-hydrogenase III large subunit